MKEEVKICANCKYYTAYYALMNNKVYRVNDGCCALLSKSRKNHELMDSCEKFNAVKVEQETCLDDMAKKLYDINNNIEELSNLLTLYRSNNKK